MIKAIYRAIAYLLLGSLAVSVFVLADAYLYKGPNLNNVRLKLNWIVEEIGIRYETIPPPKSIELLSQNDLEYAAVAWIFDINPSLGAKELERIRKARIFYGYVIGGFYNPHEKAIGLSTDYGNDDESLVHELAHHVFHTIFSATQIDNGEDLAIEVARRYMIQKRWSLALLYKTGMHKLFLAYHD